MSTPRFFGSVPLGLTVVVLAASFFLRLFLAPYVGFRADIDGNLAYADYPAKHGVTHQAEWKSEPDLPMYPPLYTYQGVILNKFAQKKLEALQSEYPQVGAVWFRVRFKLLPILYDLLTSVVILACLATVVKPPWPLIGMVAYLFNPCVFLDSALWGQTDSIHSFFMLLAVVCLVAGWNRHRDGWLIAGSAIFAFAVCQKLQSIVIVPVLATFILLRRKPLVVLSSLALFGLLMFAMYLPFVLAKRWDYIQGVFIRSFSTYPFSTLNAFSIWALGFVVSSRAKIMGVTYGQIGQALYLASVVWLCLLAAKSGIDGSDRMETARKLFLASAYACLAPFVVLTQMHERYIAPAIPFLILAACLDSRLRWLAVGFSATYTLNLLYVLRSLDAPRDSLAILNASNFAIRVFGTLLNVGMLGWFTVRLPQLLAAPMPCPPRPEHAPALSRESCG